MNRRTSFTDVVDWLEGRLPDDRARQVADAVNDDAETAEAAAWVAEFLETAERLRLQTPPAALSRSLRDMFRDHALHSVGEGWLRARLLYDTRDAASGVRLGERPGEAHLAFDSDAGRFVVELSEVIAGTVELRGLLLCDKTPIRAEVSLLEGGVVRGRVNVDAEGHFCFAQVPAAVDELRIVTEAHRLTAPLELNRS